MRLPALAATLLLLAGCLGVTKGDGASHAEGAAPLLMPPAGASYDGSAVKAIDGKMIVHTIDATNAGYVDVDLTMPDGKRLLVHWTDFHIQPNASWQDGGVAANVVEHGASGHGNKMEPQMDLFSGGWGAATATLGDTPLADPVTGNSTFNAHYMVTKEAMLDPATHAIHKADGTTPFDPKTPGDGQVHPGRNELHFALWGAGAFKDGTAVVASPNATKLADTATGPAYSKSFPIDVPEGAKLTIAPKITGGAGKLTFTLKGPDGKVVATSDATPVQSDPMKIPDRPLAAGAYALQVDGAGVQAAYEAAVTVQAPQPLWIHVVFTQVKLG